MCIRDRQIPNPMQQTPSPLVNLSQLNALQTQSTQLLQTLQTDNSASSQSPSTPAALRLGGGSITQTPNYLVGSNGLVANQQPPDNKGLINSLMNSANAEKAKTPTSLLESLIPISAVASPPANQPSGGTGYL